MKRLKAFTLAEVLITLAVIGVVAALTIPGLIKNYNEKAWSTAKSVFEKRLEVATRQMNTEEKLAGYSNTMDFVNELKKYIKITKVCDNSELTKCFEKHVIWNEEDKPIDISTVTESSGFGLDWHTETVGVQFANGINAIIVYNPKTTQEPFNNQFSATNNSMAILYDVSANKTPNTNGKDIGQINVLELANNNGCLFPEKDLGFCISRVLSSDTGYRAMSPSECSQAVSEGKLGITNCYVSNDYWAGAVKACGGTSKMTNQTHLAQLGKYLYGQTVSASGATSATLNREKASKLLSAASATFQDPFHVWSSSGPTNVSADTRRFYTNRTFYGNYGSRGNWGALAVCVRN